MINYKPRKLSRRGRSSLTVVSVEAPHIAVVGALNREWRA